MPMRKFHHALVLLGFSVLAQNEFSTGGRRLQEGCEAEEYRASVEKNCDGLKAICSTDVGFAQGYAARSLAICKEGGSCDDFVRCVEHELNRTACQTDPALSGGLKTFKAACTQTCEPACTMGMSCDSCRLEPVANPRDALEANTTYSVRRSSASELLHIFKNATSAPSRWPTPCARSYEGHEWEVVQPRSGPSHLLVQILSCNSARCRIKIPADETHSYQMGSRVLSNSCADGDSPHTECWRDRHASHLLMQATFGPTRKDIDSLSGSMSTLGNSTAAAEAWLIAQLRQNATLHRSYYRSKANPRLDTVSEVGRPREACMPFSRWNGIALRGDDVAQNITFREVTLPAGKTVTAMYVGGILRSEVDLAKMRPFGLQGPVASPAALENCNWCQSGTIAYDKAYVICRIEEWPMGIVVIGTRCRGDLWPAADSRTELYNTRLEFRSLAYPVTDRLNEPIELLELRADDSTTYPLPPTIYNAAVLVVSRFNVPCPFSLGAQTRPSTTIKKDGRYYRYDPRVVLLKNELDAPMEAEGVAADAMQRACPLLDITAPKTYLNENGCRVTHGCSPNSYTNDSFLLNATTIRAFFLSGGNFVYVIDSLPLPASSNPCTQKARWRSISACAGRATDSLDNDTTTVLANAIRFSQDDNSYVKDIELSSKEDKSRCTNAKGSIIKVDGICWEHTHEDQLNVYDFTLWGMAHEGNSASAGFFPIKRVAQQGKTVLHFPADSHPIGRWTQNAGGSWTAINAPLGRLGDRLSFDRLPRRVQSAGFAKAIGLSVISASGIPGQEVCGSPGEVANDPTHGQRFYFGKERYGNVAAYTQQEVLKNHRQHQSGNQKQMIHTMAALYAPDQLRQRVAWALSQCFVIGEFSSAVLADHGEAWTTFFDIFVRHAFGSYLDIMREVSFNPVMAMYLTFLNSGSFAYSGSVPDENYAREIMQLFSIGLWEMEMDGTHRSNSENGEKILTYTNDAVVEMARAWTGFSTRAIRGNLEQKRISQANQVDPTFIRPERRDAFPKMDLYKGYIGDAYPLCTDLHPQHFLRKGAKYRYLGRSGVPEMATGRSNWDFSNNPPVNKPIFAPNASASSLYSELCNADATTGDCRFRSSVFLQSNLKCHGEECNVNTLRVVKIAIAGTEPFFYEYVQTPCVGLAFFVGKEGGKYIENVNHIPSHGNTDELIERVCADPRTYSAAPGCCTPEGSSCFEYRCNYVEERVTFYTAMQRCKQTVWPSSAPVSASKLSAWKIYPHDYSTKPISCPDGSTMANESECMDAATAAMAAAGEPHFDAPRRFSAGSWDHRPSGCSINTHNRDVFYNRAALGAGHSGYKLVCNASTGVSDMADYHNASKDLCSRKRRKCWWGNSPHNCHAGYSYGGHQTTNVYWWTEESCQLQVQINVDGRVAVVHSGSESVRRVGLNSGNWFRVRWHNGAHPKADSGCGAACEIVAGQSGATCLCDVDMTMAPVFLDAGNLPTQREVEEALTIGAPPPEHFDTGVYSMCETAACKNSPMKVYTKGGSKSPILDEGAIFMLYVNQTRIRYLANKRSVVTIFSSDFSFRNPVTFMKLVDPAQRDALYETEALLEHLVFHKNVAPFVAKLLIQRLVSSNPSPRYVEQVSTAFRTGKYNGRGFSGKYGDLGAAICATLLDREARSLVLAADASHGQVREPILRLLHLLRSMEFHSREEREIELNRDLITQIGQAVYRSPTVFSFFRPDYSPEGPVQKSGLVAPEAQLGILPYIIGYMDGLSSLIFDGLSSCNGGFGALCYKNANTAPQATSLANDGYLGFVSSNVSTPDSVVSELDLLLTAGRLDRHTRDIVISEYRRAFNLSSCPSDRSASLCGRLVPGDILHPGEFIENRFGEVLCVTYDGVVKHIGADGKELYSTSYLTRGGKTALRYEGSVLKIAGPVHWGFSANKWTSDSYEVGQRDVFHPFLSGPCKLLDQSAHERVNTFGYASHGANTQTITCTAESTCGQPAVAKSAEYVTERAKTDSKHALKVALNLLAASAAFAVTNEPATTAAKVPPLPVRSRKTANYKALVVLFMAGGADTFNLLLPHSKCNNNNSEWYTRTRGAAALKLNSVHQIAVQPGQQPCSIFGIHPELNTLKQLWDEGDACFFANVGALVEPVTVKQVIEREGRLPAGLFAHNLQTQSSKTLFPQSTTGNTGVLGRVFAAFEKQGHASGQTTIKAGGYSIAHDKTIFRGSPVEPILLSSYQGMLTYEGSQTAERARNMAERNASLKAFERLSNRHAHSIYAETYNAGVRSSLADSERISGLLNQAELLKDWDAAIGQASVGHGKSFVAQFKQAASVIAARDAFGAERDVIYVELGGFDTHSNVLADTQKKYRDINIALKIFAEEMKAQGVWKNVSVLSLSEFGRTMTSNGAGTDHAWGGNHFLVGGDVRGGNIHGKYPELRVDGPESVGPTGAMLPSSPWEAIWKPLSLWLGVEPKQLEDVMPNLHEFTSEHTLERNKVFLS